MEFKSNNFFFKNIFYFLFTIYFITGLSIFRDYGISVDEEFQRYSGFYWLNYILQFLPFNTLEINALNRLNEIGGFTLPNPKDFPFYGVVFDVPLAFLETILNIQDSKTYFLLRHFFNFIIFFISSIYFYKILESRYKNKVIIFLGVLLYISSPRIFADSFYNNKDIIFLSLVTISIYFQFKLLDNFNYKNIFYFSLFSGLTCAARVLGIFLPLSFLLFSFFSFLNKSLNLRDFKKIIAFLFLFFIFLFLFWPYLWEDPIKNLLYSFKVFSDYTALKIQMLFNGRYIFSNLLPLSYLPTWISITTPIVSLILFIIGFSYLLKRFFIRITGLKNINIHEDLWRGNNEKKDFLIFLIFTSIAVYIILSNAVLYTGWRHLYFLHFFMIYVATFGIYFLHLVLKKRKYLIYFITILILMNFYQIFKFHPYQNLYFNFFITDNKKNDFEIDYWGLAGVRFIRDILLIENNKTPTRIGVASYLPLERSLKMLNKEEAKLIKIVGQDFKQADYIFNNNMSEVDKNKNNKYDIPKNFEKISEFNLEGFTIYELYRKIK